jgi:hypothetical protein
MPLADLLSRARQPDDEVDQIGSTSSTPPGAVTPRPDLTDKRLPGIAHSYLGQVGDLSNSLLKLHYSESSTTSSPNTPGGKNKRTTMAAQAGLIEPQTGVVLKKRKKKQSSCSSEYSSQTRGSADLQLSDTDLCEPANLHIDSMAEKVEERSSSCVVSSMNNTDTLHELESQEQGLPAQSLSIRPTLLRILSYCSLSFTGQNVQLTGKPSAISQSTPPQTPRTQSQAEPTPSGADTPRSSTKIQTEGTTLGPVLGKLSVLISEGRGLRPSVNPYVVCEFQLSQYISDGPAKDSGSDSKKPSYSNGASATAQAVMAGGRKPMAIPMRSRQSSRSGRDTSAEQEVVNPKWNHRALL